MLDILFWSAAAWIAYSFIGFPLIVAVRALVRPRRTSDSIWMPNISVVIAARNEARHIGAKLDSVLACEYPADRLDVIVVSDGSTDDTESIVAAYKNHGVRLLSRPAEGKAAALNAAIACSGAEVIVFTDANGVLAPDALRELLGPLRDSSVGGVAGDQCYIARSATSAISVGELRYWSVERMLKRAESRGGSVVSATGGLYAVRRTLIDPIPADVTDDAFVSTGVVAKGFRLVFKAQARVYEPLAPAGSQEWTRKVRVITRGWRTVASRRELLNPLRYGFYSVQLLSHKILRRVVVVPLTLCLVTSLLLWPTSLAFRALSLAQLAFYGAGVLGVWLSGTTLGRIPVLAVPAYFCAANAASTVALWNFLSRRSIESWRPTREVEDQSLPSGIRPRKSPASILQWLLVIGSAAVAGGAVGSKPAAAMVALLVILGSVAIVARPTYAVLVAIALLYSNVLVVIIRDYGAPSPIVLVVPLLLAFALGASLLRGRRRFHVSPVVPLLMVYLAIQLVSALGARDRQAAIADILTFAIEGLLLFILVTNAIDSRELLTASLRVVLAVAAILGGLALVKSVVAPDARVFGLALDDESAQRWIARQANPEEAAQRRSENFGGLERQGGPIGEPGRFGQILVVAVPVGLVFARHAATRRSRAASYAAVLAVVGGVALTFSRGALLGLLAAVLLLAFLRVLRVGPLLVGAALLIAAMVFVPAFGLRVFSIYGVAGLANANVNVDSSIQGRYTENVAALLVFRDNPWLGAGPGNYAIEYREYANKAPLLVRSGERQAHNLYLGVAAETGLAGLLTLLAILLVTSVRVWRKYRAAGTEEDRLRAAGLLAMFTALLVTSVFLHFAFIRYFWLIVALIAAEADVEATESPISRLPARVEV